MNASGVMYFPLNLRIKFSAVDFYIVKYDNYYEMISGADISCP